MQVSGRSKYNVSRDKSKRTYDGIVFDSELEMKYYKDVVLPGVASGEIVDYQLQKPYELQPKYCKQCGRRAVTVRAIPIFTTLKFLSKILFWGLTFNS